MIVRLLVSTALAGAPAPPGLLDRPLDPSAEPPPVVLDDEALAALRNGEAVYGYERDVDADVGWSAVLLRVRPDDIWPHVLDMDAYVTYLPYVTGSANDRAYTAGGHPVRTGSLALTTKGITTHYEVVNHCFTDRGWVAFTIASRSGAPLKEGRGWWRSEPWPDDPGLTLLTYRVVLDTSWYVPGWFKRKAASTGLPRLAALVGRRAEEAAAVASP